MYIVISKTLNGRLVASPSPFKHTTLKSAKVEAARLAHAFPDKTFYPMKSLKAHVGRIASEQKAQKYAHVFN